MNDMEYKLLDSGNGLKLERFGSFTLIRPCLSAVWTPKLHSKVWEEADGLFTRETGWKLKRDFPESWEVTVQGIRFKLKRTDFGHLGVFPEHSFVWKRMQELLSTAKSKRVLNLFAYSGGATLAAAKAGAEVCHLDAAKGMVAWARENAELNGLENHPIRWIVDDAAKFLTREKKRGQVYDGIILDPPSYGRGKSGEIFKIENSLHEILNGCMQLFSSDPLFFILTCHTPGYTPLVLKQLLEERLGTGQVVFGEMTLPQNGPFVVPAGSYAIWSSR